MDLFTINSTSPLATAMPGGAPGPASDLAWRAHCSRGMPRGCSDPRPLSVPARAPGPLALLLAAGWAEGKASWGVGSDCPEKWTWRCPRLTSALLKGHRLPDGTVPVALHPPPCHTHTHTRRPTLVYTQNAVCHCSRRTAALRARVRAGVGDAPGMSVAAAKANPTTGEGRGLDRRGSWATHGG
jgi:hypothetical protein